MACKWLERLHTDNLKTMKKLLPFPVLFLLCLHFTACDSEQEEAQPVPLPEAEMSRTFFYVYEEPQSAEGNSYSDMGVETYASLDTEGLNVTFGAVPRFADTDVIHFQIAKPQLTGNYVGTYTLKSLPDTNIGAADVLYTYRRTGNSSAMLASSFSTMDGNFTITAYNAKNKLISGTYEVKLEAAIDPKRYDITEPNIRRCDITIKGTFTNVRIIQ